MGSLGQGAGTRKDREISEVLAVGTQRPRVATTQKGGQEALGRRAVFRGLGLCLWHRYGRQDVWRHGQLRSGTEQAGAGQPGPACSAVSRWAQTTRSRRAPALTLRTCTGHLK